MRQLCKGNVAIVKGAILAGCRSFYGYPITPASEIAEAAALYIPQVGAAHSQGLRVGLFRPITLCPFPSPALAKAAAKVQKVLVVELSTGQMVEDVRLALNGRVPVEFYGRAGGNVPSLEEIHADLLALMTPAVHSNGWGK